MDSTECVCMGGPVSKDPRDEHAPDCPARSSDNKDTKLTDTQTKALKKIQAKGIWHAYNGISRATITALERARLVTIERTVQTWTNRRSGRSHSQLDWTARPAVSS